MNLKLLYEGKSAKCQIDDEMSLPDFCNLISTYFPEINDRIKPGFSLELLHNYPPISISGPRLSEPIKLKSIGIVTGTAVTVRVVVTPFPKMAIRRVIDADNSCLFNAIGYLINGGNTTGWADLYREIIASTVQQSRNFTSSSGRSETGSQSYTQPAITLDEAVLGMSPLDYANWIRDSNHWGGEIEMTIIAAYARMQICAIDVQTGNLYTYPCDNIQGSGSRRIYLLYDGIHYDALVKDYTSAAEPSQGHVHSNSEERDFDSSDSATEREMLSLARTLRDQRQFVDLAGCDVRCLVCGAGLQGQNEAVEHAKITGHTNFGQT